MRVWAKFHFRPAACNEKNIFKIYNFVTNNMYNTVVAEKTKKQGA
jgi:hypothetical protein